MSWFNYFKPMSEEEFRRHRELVLKQIPVPAIWLFGKTGSGKTSIIKYLTGADSAEIGNGFRPQTKTSSTYDFPQESAPLLRFLDTRGLGEAGYDPARDIDEFTGSAHLMIVTVRVMDHAISEIVNPLRSLRRQFPERPVLLALTCLHDAYPGKQHPVQDPFNHQGELIGDWTCENLQKSLEHHNREFSGLADRIVPIDFTQVDEGFQPTDFGGDRLKRAIVDLLPETYRETLLRVEQSSTEFKGLTQKQAGRWILSYSTMAASAAAVPVPWVDMPLVLGIQTRLIYKLAEIHQQPIDASTIAKAFGAVGGQIALRMGIREMMKAVPWVGSVVNAAGAFAYTYGTGMAWNWYFTEVKGGHIPTPEELKSKFQEQIAQAERIWNVSRESQPASQPNSI